MKQRHLFILLTGLCVLLFGQGHVLAMVYYNDGGTYVIDTPINDQVNISNGTQISLINGGSVSGSIVLEYDAGSFTMSGGYIGNGLFALGPKPVYITGGIINSQLSLDSYSLNGSDDDNVYLYGTDFQIDNVSVDYGTYHVSGHLNGILASGDLIDVDFNCSGGNDLILAAIPEPATLIMLGLGGLIIRRRR